MKKRIVLAITGIRSDYNALHSVLKAINEHPKLELKLIVTGAHLLKSFGYTIENIKKDGFKIEETIESLSDTNSQSSRIKSLSTQLLKLADTVQNIKPDIIISAFDREEALTAAILGSYLNIPVAHIGGGDKVEGNVDDYVRHAVTKLSHLHFPSTKENAERIIKMGEEKWRVFTVGSTGLDKFVNTKKMSKKELSNVLDLDVSKKPLVVLLQHPVSTELDKAKEQISISLEALKELKYTTIIIKPNSDSGNREMVEEIDKYSSKYSFMKSYITLEKEVFVNLLSNTDVLIGNSSCGVIQTPLIKLPTINVGTRQTGRLHAENVIFVKNDKEEIKNAIKTALYDKLFLEKVKNCVNPYGDGKAGERIADILAKIDLDKEKLLNKKMVY